MFSREQSDRMKRDCKTEVRGINYIRNSDIEERNDQGFVFLFIFYCSVLEIGYIYSILE